MQALSKKRWAKMTPEERRAHGKRLGELHKARAKDKLKTS